MAFGAAVTDEADAWNVADAGATGTDGGSVGA